MAALNASGRTIQLPGRAVTVVFDINSLILVEERLGSLDAIEESMKTRPLAAIRFLLWVGMGQVGTEQDAGILLTGASLEDVMTAIAAAIVEAIGSDKGEQPADPTRAPVASTPGTS